MLTVRFKRTVDFGATHLFWWRAMPYSLHISVYFLNATMERWAAEELWHSYQWLHSRIQEGQASCLLSDEGDNHIPFERAAAVHH